MMGTTVIQLPDMSLGSLQSACRTCLGTDSEQTLVPLYDHSAVCGFAPADVLRDVFPNIQLNHVEPLPTSICNACIAKIVLLKKFYADMEEAQRMLALYLEHSKGTGLECTEVEYLSENDPQQFNDDGTADEAEYSEDKKLELATSLSCHFCGKEYKRISHLRRHVAKHDEDDPERLRKFVKRSTVYYKCFKCGKRFTDPIAFAHHAEQQQCVSLANPQCRFCKEKFPSIETLEAHLIEVHPTDRPHVCPICGKGFQNVFTRNSHIESHNSDSSYFCDICGQSYKCLQYLKKHIRARHTVMSATCTYCGLHFTNRAKFEYHLKSHEPNKPFRCRFCEKSFLQQHHLSNHERIHTGSRPFLCNICGKSFKHEPNFAYHLKRHSGLKCRLCGKLHSLQDCEQSNDCPNQCEHCGKEFPQMSTLSAHLRTHTGETPYRCDQCDKSFAQSHQLKYHRYTMHNDVSGVKTKCSRKLAAAETTHDAEKKVICYPYVCAKCNKAFRLPSSLASHEKIHQEDRKHVCAECGQTFKQAKYLKVHIDGVHLKRKPYSCNLCNKSFTQSGDRNQHMKKHTDDRPHKCTYCSKSFTLAKSLRAHLRLHTGDKPFRCIICDERFISYKGLAAHDAQHSSKPDPETEKAPEDAANNEATVDICS